MSEAANKERKTYLVWEILARAISSDPDTQVVMKVIAKTESEAMEKANERLPQHTKKLVAVIEYSDTNMTQFEYYDEVISLLRKYLSIVERSQ